MASWFWPWRRNDSSPASFEKELSALSAKITATDTRIANTTAKARKLKAFTLLYLGFAYVVYGIVVLLVVGYKNMGAWEWSGLAGGPVFIYLIRTITTTYFDHRAGNLKSKLQYLQKKRADTIKKLKDATKYDSTLELIEKYGGSENKQKPKKKSEAGNGAGAGIGEEKKPQPKQQHRQPSHTFMQPPPTANIQRPWSAGALVHQGAPASGTLRPGTPSSAEFAPNAFDDRAFQQLTHYPPATMGAPPEPHWYDRILDALLGEDETAAKNRIVLLCSRCRLVNGQAPPGTKSLSELGTWKCMACGAPNGEIDEGERIVQAVLKERASESKTMMNTKDETTDEEDGGRSSIDIVEVKKDDAAEEVAATPASAGVRKRRGKNTT
ncbi:hypothetical protein QBC35DRAFT_47426 [Podospora australis]|uniref:Endoplasmic reticulum junction formation protein lunapark n=1 Tax=Podospora australis TaxID=1536484 RepID=A0AAN6WM53_9PEZI|nr:hypothetical protein QBC35DRAFT_47426 [Podospora australis]